jgi:hypothetical protein
MIRLSQRYDADDIGRRLSERNKGAATLNHPNPDPSLFAIVLTRVGTNQKGAAKHLFCLREMDPVLPDVGPVFGLIPFK